ncbi:ABC transporter substrate-binding protein [Pseudofrankia asymbiotica]|uniref:ABC transporter substrate-binding protein n=1 Tax=Pseudofrankia asymbiotica TaxID=1834516 RepID=UPI001F5185BC|nr:ABC transporter substrate-binding protein [Pseudofrankia asymbiotica]
MTDTEVKAGLLFSDTGATSSGTLGFRAGVDARLGVANAEGGVHGRKIVYSWRDDGSDPHLNLVGARELVESEEAFGLLEGPAVAAGSAQYLAGQDIPAIGLAAEAAWNDYENMFSWFYVAPKSGSSTVYGEFVRGQGGTRAALVTSALNPAVQAFQQQLGASLQAAGVQVELTVEALNDVTSFEALAARMKAANVDTLAGVLFPDVLAKLLPAVRAAGVKLKAVLVPFGYDQRLLAQLGPALAGTVIYTTFVPFEAGGPTHRAFLKAMQTYAPQIQAPAQDAALYGWLTADLFLHGLQAAGPCPTRQAFVQGLRAVHNYDGGGLLPGPIDLATNRGRSSDCFDFVRVSDDGTSYQPLEPVMRCGRPIS